MSGPVARVLILDEQPLWRQALEAMVSPLFPQPLLTAVSAVDAAIDWLTEGQPKLAIIDLSHAELAADRAFEEIARLAAPAALMALDRRAAVSQLRRARLAGARGYIAKTSSPGLIEAAIGVVVADGEYYQTPDEGFAAAPTWVERLTPRQREALELLSKGKTNAEIAHRLDVSLPTAKLHVHAVIRAAGARNRTEAVLKAREVAA